MRTLLPTQEGSIDVLQQDDTLLGSYSKEMVESIVREAPITQVEHTDAILQLPSQGSAAMETMLPIHNHKKIEARLISGHPPMANMQ